MVSCHWLAIGLGGDIYTMGVGKCCNLGFLTYLLPSIFHCLRVYHFSSKHEFKRVGGITLEAVSFTYEVFYFVSVSVSPSTFPISFILHFPLYCFLSFNDYVIKLETNVLAEIIYWNCVFLIVKQVWHVFYLNSFKNAPPFFPPLLKLNPKSFFFLPYFYLSSKPFNNLLTNSMIKFCFKANLQQI